MPDTVHYIGRGALEYCEQLTDVKLPQSLTYIGESAFSSCNLKEVTIPGKVETIGSCAFSFNSDLTKVEFLDF